MSTLLDQYNRLKAKRINYRGGFISQGIDSDKVFRVAMDEQYNPIILISQKAFKNSRESKSNFKLDKLIIQFDLICKIHDIESGTEIEEPFTIIKQINGNSRMHEYFLRVIEGVVSELRNDLSINKLNQELEYLLKLFSTKKKVSEAVILGLWGELVFILSYVDMPEAIKAWHIDIDNLFDFTFEDHNVEVKTTTKSERIHEFNNKQIKQYKRLNVEVISIVTNKATLGKSIMDLWTEIENYCTDSESIDKLSKTITATALNDVESLYQIKFDHSLASSTMRQINSNLIPHIEDSCIPNNVNQVKVQVNLDTIGHS